MTTTAPPHIKLSQSQSYDTTSTSVALDAIWTIQRTRQTILKHSITNPLYEMRMYLERIGVDITTMNFIHIAGSKGKGSTSTYVENLLFHAGFKTGLYTSPNLVSIVERYRINTKTVIDTIFLDAVWYVWDKLISTCDQVPIIIDPKDPSRKVYAYPPLPAFFAFLTLISFYLFKVNNVDIIVCEVGLGGAVDATNVITPLITAITTLSLEHTEILGHTIDKIARVKCGIFKPNVPIVVFPQEKLAWDVIIDAANQVNQSPILISSSNQYKYIQLGIPGQYQPQNSNVALILAAYSTKLLINKGVLPRNLTNLSFLHYTSLCQMYLDVKNEFLTTESFNQPGISDMCLLRTLRTFDSLITQNNDDHDNNNHNNTLVVGNNTANSSNENSIDDVVLDSDQHVKNTVYMMMPHINPLLDLEAWIDLFHHDLNLYFNALKQLQGIQINTNLNNTNDDDDDDDDNNHIDDNRATNDKNDNNNNNALNIVEQVNKQMKITNVKYNQNLNYLTFHFTTLLPQFIRALCTTRLRGRCDTVYNTFSLPLDHNTSYINTNNETTINNNIPSSTNHNADISLPLSNQLDVQPHSSQTPIQPHQHSSLLSQLYKDIILWHIDGAHTPDSISACLHWYQERIQHEPISLIIERERSTLLASMPCTKTDTPPVDTSINNTTMTTTTTNIPTTIRNNSNKICRSSTGIQNIVQTILLPFVSKYPNCIRPFQQLVLLFNCGHVRSPFLLYQPIIEQFFTKEIFVNYLTRVSELNNQYKLFNLKQCQLGNNQQHFQQLSITLPFFQHFFFCPFDMDKPTDVPLPSLGELFEQYYNNNTDVDKLDNADKKKNFSLGNIADIINNEVYSILTCKNNQSGTGEMSDHNASCDNNYNHEEKLTQDKISFRSFMWQFQTMVILDYLIQESLFSGTNKNDFNNSLTVSSHTPVLLTLSNMTKSVLPNDHNVNLYTDIVYNNNIYIQPHTDIQQIHPNPSEPPLNPLKSPFSFHTTNSTTFHPPLATLIRPLMISEQQHDLDNDKLTNSIFNPHHTLYFHIMPSSYDAIMAIQYIALQHQQSIQAIKNMKTNLCNGSVTPSSNISNNDGSKQHVHTNDVLDQDTMINNTTTRETNSNNQTPVQNILLNSPQCDTTTRVLVVGSLYLAGDTLKSLNCKI